MLQDSWMEEKNLFILCGVKTANKLCCLIQAPNQKAVCLDLQAKSPTLSLRQSYKACLAVSREYDVLLMIVSGLSIYRWWSEHVIKSVDEENEVRFLWTWRKMPEQMPFYIHCSVMPPFPRMLCIYMSPCSWQPCILSRASIMVLILQKERTAQKEKRALKQWIVILWLSFYLTYSLSGSSVLDTRRTRKRPV